MDFVNLKPFPKQALVLPVCSSSLLNTLWKKEKSLVMSNFYFSHSVFHPFGNFLQFSSNMKLLSANSFTLEESKICRLGKDYSYDELVGIMH